MDEKLLFGQRLLELRKKSNKNQADVAKVLGISQPAYQNYENGRREAGYATIAKLADFYGVSTDYLLGREKPKPKKMTLSDAELEAALLEAYRTFPEDVRRDFLDHIRNAVLAERGDIRLITKRFISGMVSAGFGDILNDYENSETVLVPLTEESRRADFVLRVHGDSMEPMFSDGDYVLVKHQDAIDPGEIGIFALNGEGYIKKLGNNALISLNEKYPEIPVTPEDTSTCFGKVLGKTTISEE